MIVATTEIETKKRYWHAVSRRFGLLVLWCLVAVLSVWCTAALYIDLRAPLWRLPLLISFVAALVAVPIRIRSRWGPIACLGLCSCVMLWWFSLKPSNVALWREDTSRTAWVSVRGHQATIHNFRNCDYRTETSFTNCWTDKTVDLKDLRSADLFFTNWGVRWIGHPIVSFQFGDHDHVAFSIEARYKVGQSYSAVLGFFRQYELIFLVADERDVIRLRTNYRKDEEVYLYRTSVGPTTARKMFDSYTDYVNKLDSEPEWYNALTRNCTTTMDKQVAEDTANPQPWNYQLVLNGSLDGLLYSRGRLVTDGLSFQDLRNREHINKVANEVNSSPEFSAAVRSGRIGF